MSEPTYLLWTPRTLGNDRQIRFNVTALSVPRWPEGGADFYTEVLADMGLEAIPESCDVLPFRSRYHGDPDADDWRDRWKRNWRVSVRCKTSHDMEGFEEGYETEALAEAPPLDDPEPIHIFVLADFATEKGAESARGEIAKASEDAAFELFSVEYDGFWQLQVDLGPRSRDFFSGDTESVDVVERICRGQGGWPTFDERIENLG